MSLFFVRIPLIQLVLGTVSYAVLGKLESSGDENLDTKFAFLHKWGLGWGFLCIWVISLARNRIGVNANANRAAARLDRPDQHIYKVMDRNASVDAPYVLMATTGAAGRFNRAQRGAFNTDESMPTFLVNTVLASGIFGPFVLALVLVAAWGRITFALGYTQAADKRGSGLTKAFIAEKWCEGLVLIIGLKALLGARAPL